jgi:hypothetical protein
MSKVSSKSAPSDGPEFAVHRDVICAYFSPPLASSTFHDFVKKGKIVPFKHARGLYLLNDSLRRLGLKEVSELPVVAPSRTPEEIIRLAFVAIDPEVFPPPSWLLGVETISDVDTQHAKLVFKEHEAAVRELATDREKHQYLQGVLDAAFMMAAYRLSKDE